MRNDNTVSFYNTILQIPRTRQRHHYVRCPVTVHQFTNGKLGVSYQGRLLGLYETDGERLRLPRKKQKRG